MQDLLDTLKQLRDARESGDKTEFDFVRGVGGAGKVQEDDVSGTQFQESRISEID